MRDDGLLVRTPWSAAVEACANYLVRVCSPSHKGPVSDLGVKLNGRRKMPSARPLDSLRVSVRVLRIRCGPNSRLSLTRLKGRRHARARAGKPRILDLSMGTVVRPSPGLAILTCMSSWGEPGKTQGFPNLRLSCLADQVVHHVCCRRQYQISTNRSKQ